MDDSLNSVSELWDGAFVVVKGKFALGSALCHYALAMFQMQTVIIMWCVQQLFAIFWSRHIDDE
jgi:hypothetical protein